MLEQRSFECNVGDRKLVIESGKLAGQANASVIVRYGETVALVFPTGWAMHALHQLIAFGREFHEIGTPLLVLLLYGVVFSIAGARLLRV